MSSVDQQMPSDNLFAEVLNEFSVYRESAQCTEPKEKIIKNVKVDQNWVERAKNFAEVFFSMVEISDVDGQFRNSEYTNFDEFLLINGLSFFESQYIMAKSKHMILKTETVEKCFKEARPNPSSLTIEQFCKEQNILKLKDNYVKVATNYPKTKLLEILVGLNISEMSEEGILTVDLLDDLFQSKTTSLKMMLACYLSGIGSLLTTDNQTLSCNGLSVLTLSAYPIALIIDPQLFKVMQEWVSMTLDRLVDLQKQDVQLKEST